MKAKRKKGTSPRTRAHDISSDARELKMFVAEQIRHLRGNMSQAAFGKLIGKPQSVVSRLEDPAYGKATLQTLIEIASKCDMKLIVQFVSPETHRKLKAASCKEEQAE